MGYDTSVLIYLLEYCRVQDQLRIRFLIFLKCLTVNSLQGWVGWKIFSFCIILGEIRGVRAVAARSGRCAQNYRINSGSNERL